MHRLHYGQNFEKSPNRKTHYHGIVEHPKIGKFAKFGCENVVKCGKCKPVKIANFVYFCITHGKLIPTSRKRYQFSVRNTKDTKFANFTGLYFPHSTTFRDQTLPFY